VRVLVLTQYYDPEPIPKPGDLARELKRRGHDVTVVTGFPNYPEGQLYPGFALRVLQRETRDGVNVLRGVVYPYHGPVSWRRVANYVSFVLSATVAAMRAGPFDVIYVWHPPLTIGIAAWLISRWHHAPFLYDVQDVWPESVAASGMSLPPAILRWMSLLERFVYAQAAHVLVKTDGARLNLMGKGVRDGMVSVLSQWVDAAALQEPSPEARSHARREFGWGTKFIVLFAGNFGLVQGLDSVLEAAGRLSSGDQIRFVLIGDGVEKQRLVERARAAGLQDRLQFLDRVPADRIPPILAAADALLVTLKPSILADLVIPLKIFSSLAAGRPLVVAAGGESERLVREIKAGVVAAPGDAVALADAVRRLKALPEDARASMGASGRAYARDHLTRERVIATYEDILARLAREGP